MGRGPGPMSQPLSLLGVFKHHLWASVQGGLFRRASDPAFVDSTNTVYIQTRLKTYELHYSKFQKPLNSTSTSQPETKSQHCAHQPHFPTLAWELWYSLYPASAREGILFLFLTKLQMKSLVSVWVILYKNSLLRAAQRCQDPQKKRQASVTSWNVCSLKGTKINQPHFFKHVIFFAEFL